MKEIKLLFYQTPPSPKNLGMKIVLIAVTDSEGKIVYDYGMADWMGTEWDVIPVPEGYTTSVHSWANWPDPKILLSGLIIS